MNTPATCTGAGLPEGRTGSRPPVGDAAAQQEQADRAAVDGPPVEPSLAERCEAALSTLAGFPGEQELTAARSLLGALRSARLHQHVLRLAETLVRLDPQDTATRIVQAQALIEIGQASVALDVLDVLAPRLARASRDWSEARGLSGRAWKQIFCDAGDKSTDRAHAALLNATAAYREAFEADARNTWQGVNLLALLYRARQIGLKVAPEYQIAALARQLIDTLERTPEGDRDEWFAATLAEAAIGLGDSSEAARYLRDYVGRPDLTAFAVASTLRQFSEVWNLGQNERGRMLLDILRARQLQLPEAEVSLPPGEVRRLQTTTPPSKSQLEALLGKEGPRTYQWWLAGIRRARSVASIRRRLGARCGTGFLVRAGDFGLAPADELLLLTNEHVVNELGQYPGIRPVDAEVVFEAVEGSLRYEVESIVWSAPRDRQDACLLRLTPEPVGIETLRIASKLPAWPPAVSDAAAPRVYVIGYPGGRELQFSFQDNELLGHEGPPHGKPPNPSVCRVHYRAPTEGGSSGSPVFDDNGWEVIALHHLGGQLGMPLLNGETGTYAANEGIWIGSIVAAIGRERAPQDTLVQQSGGAS